MGWHDIGRWLLSPGFGGAAAVLAASLAFWAAQTGRRSANQRALRNAGGSRPAGLPTCRCGTTIGRLWALRRWPS